MAGTWILFKRELRSYFFSPIAYVIGALFLLYVGWSFFQFIFIDAGGTAQARMGRYFVQLPLAFLILVPALSMRLWAEERKLGTMELLLTFPVKSPPLIAGKFLAALSFIAILLFLTLPYAITISSLGNLDWGPVIGGYLGALLLAGAYLSLGIFCSSITRDQIIALILSVVLLVVLFLLGDPQMAFFFPAGLAELFTMVSPTVHFQSIARGVIDLTDVIYFFVFAGFFLFANAVVIEIRKWIG